MTSDLTSNQSSALRDGAIETIRILIEERDEIAEAPDVDLEEAERQVDAILSEHAGAIAELGINGALDLITMQRGGAYDVDQYRQALRSLDNARLVAEAEANAELSEELVGRIEARKRLTMRLAVAAQTVVRGVLMTAISQGIAAAAAGG